MASETAGSDEVDQPDNALASDPVLSSFQELFRSGRVSTWREIFAACDTDGNNVLSRDEFHAAFNTMSRSIGIPAPTRLQINAVWSRLSHSGAAPVTLELFAKACSRGMPIKPPVLRRMITPAAPSPSTLSPTVAPGTPISAADTGSGAGSGVGAGSDTSAEARLNSAESDTDVDADALAKGVTEVPHGAWLRLLERARARRVVPWIGSGMSAFALPSWGALIRQVWEETASQRQSTCGQSFEDVQRDAKSDWAMVTEVIVNDLDSGTTAFAHTVRGIFARHVCDLTRQLVLEPIGASGTSAKSTSGGAQALTPDQREKCIRQLSRLGCNDTLLAAMDDASLRAAAIEAVGRATPSMLRDLFNSCKLECVLQPLSAHSLLACVAKRDAMPCVVTTGCTRCWLAETGPSS